MKASLNVAVIDDEASARSSLARLLKAGGIEVLSFGSAREFLEDARLQELDCVVTDLRMPGVDGLMLQETLARMLPHLSLVFVTGHGDIPMTVRAMKGGAVDFLEKPIDDRALLAAIERATQRSRELRLEQGDLANLRRRYEALTPRQKGVFRLVTAGLLNKQAGAHLGISEKTIKVHRGRIMEQMGARSLAELVRMAARLGIRAEEAVYAAARGRVHP